MGGLTFLLIFYINKFLIKLLNWLVRKGGYLDS
jgi:hypothetical protein